MENASKSSGSSMEKETTVLDPSCISVACEDMKNVSLLASTSEYATTSSPTTFFSALSAPLSNEKKAEIERSKVHWSELMACDDDDDDDEVAEVSNMKVFKLLQSHPTCGDFFRTFGDGGVHDYGELEVGEKLAEGGQAEIYHACVTWNDRVQVAYDKEIGVKYVLKVFRKGTFLRDLQKQWPEGIFREYEDIVERTELGKCQQTRWCSQVVCGTLLEDGRFAFLLVREIGDLRTLIDHEMKGRLCFDCGPFAEEMGVAVMYVIAQGVDYLHNLDIIHRDLKASNVLYDWHGTTSFITEYAWMDDPIGYTRVGFCIADYECSIGVIGTGFFRAPEILQALKDKVVNSTPNLFTKASDVYSYGMVCYEILTGRLPFEGHHPNDYDLVLKGQRPEVPHYVPEWICDLLFRCWQANPSRRPTFREILSLLEANSEMCRDLRRTYVED